MRRSSPIALSLAVSALVAVAAPSAAAPATPVFSARAAWDGPSPAAGASALLQVTITIEPGWHVNSNTPLDQYLIPTAVRLELPAGWTADAAKFPPHKQVRLAFSEEPLAVFEGAVTVSIPIRVAAGAALPAQVKGVVEAQACNDKLCLAPAQVPFSVAVAGSANAATGVPAASSEGAAAPTGGLSARFASSSLLLQLAIVFIAGLALNLTPCVYPLIPITIGFFVSQKGASRARTWLLAVAYVAGMSATYSVLGVAAALTGKLFGSALQSPWVVAVIAAVLLALAASMFGLWELRVPGWATRLSGGRSGVAGALLMGLMVGFVAAPCIGPFVLGLLTYVGQRQDALLGFVLFFALSLGLGIPYLLLGVSTRALDKLPNSGAWMLGVRQLFGVVLVVLAAYFVRPFVPAPWGDWLFAGLLGLGGLYLLVIARPAHEQPWVDRFMRIAATAMIVSALHVAPRAHKTAAALAWEPFDEKQVAAAIESGMPVVIDFQATWCLPCRELEEKTFPAPEVASRLGAFRRFKADMTTSTDENRKWTERFEVRGMPTIVFFNRGKEIDGARLSGFEPPDEFLKRLALVTK